MNRSVTYRFNNEADRQTESLEEILESIAKLNAPGTSLLTNPDGLKGCVDFHVLNDYRIEMEIAELPDDDFATIDLPVAARVMEIALTDKRVLPLRKKLDGLSIKWLV